MPPEPLPAATPDLTNQRFLLDMFRLVADARVYGALWLDQDLIVRQTFGPLVSFVEAGRPVTQSLVPFIGLEDELRALPMDTGHILELPAVAVRAGDTTTPRLNFSVFWIKSHALYMVLVYRSSAQTELEMELSRQIRARLMAEEEVMQKSKELAKTNTELERANGDLEAYASIIAHDLKSPLRAMRHLVDDIGHSFNDASAAAVVHNLEALKFQSQRMSDMMAALLDYSAIGQKQETVEAVNTARLLDAIVRSLPHPDGISICIQGEWPVVQTSKAPLDLVLRNLIDNAVKHHDRAVGAVTISAEETPAVLTISIADDGPGIAPELQRAIFLPFRKGSDRETDGHGMGLALVKRTIELQGGRLDVQSDPDHRRGATFIVRWPKSNG